MVFLIRLAQVQINKETVLIATVKSLSVAIHYNYPRGKSVLFFIGNIITKRKRVVVNIYIMMIRNELYTQGQK